jgi:hypothetical protein
MSNPATTMTTIEHVPADITSWLGRVWRRLLSALATSRRRQAERTIADYRAMLGKPRPTEAWRVPPA